MNIQHRTESISEYLSKQVDNEAKLNDSTPNNLKNMLKSSLQSCKTVAKPSLAISMSAVGMLLTGQPEKVQAATSANILNNFLSDSSQVVLNWESNFIRKSKFFALKQNLLYTLNINQNTYKNLSSKLPGAEIGKQVQTKKAQKVSNTFKLDNPYKQNLSLAKQPNWSSSTGELTNNKYQISSEQKPKEYIFQIPSLETTQEQHTEPNSKSPVVKNTVKQIYVVKQGDTLNEIASRYGLSRQQLIEKNNIQNPDIIFVSQQITIPQTKVQESFITTGKSNSLVSTNNSTKIVAQNNNQEDNSSKQNFAPQLSELDNSATDNYENYEEEIANPLGINITLGTTITPELPPLSSPEQYLPASPAEFDGYIWPARGTLTSGYGWRWGRAHRGIDIAAPIGTPILAAAPGEVISAGWHSGGYGNLVKVKHPNGSVTLYAHNHRIMVRRGQKVTQGQQIAQMGSTGYSTGSHLHFEIRSNGKTTVNPIAYLPKK